MCNRGKTIFILSSSFVLTFPILSPPSERVALGWIMWPEQPGDLSGHLELDLFWRPGSLHGHHFSWWWWLYFSTASKGSSTFEVIQQGKYFQSARILIKHLSQCTVHCSVAAIAGFHLCVHTPPGGGWLVPQGRRRHLHCRRESQVQSWSLLKFADKSWQGNWFPNIPQFKSSYEVITHEYLAEIVPVAKISVLKF